MKMFSFKDFQSCERMVQPPESPTDRGWHQADVMSIWIIEYIERLLSINECLIQNYQN